MKNVSLVLLLVAPLWLAAEEVRPGASLAEVRAALGAPRGQLHLGGRHLLYYDRGEVELQGGSVTRVALLSADEQAAREVKRAADAVRIREEQEMRRARLSAEGEALKTRKLADPAFLAAPPDRQLAFWENFSRQYAEVPVAELMSAARLQLTGQRAALERAEQAERIAELEARVAAAEARADLMRRRLYISYYDRGRGRRHTSNNLWPIEYQFNDGIPQPWVSPTTPPPARLVDLARRQLQTADDPADRSRPNTRHCDFQPDDDFRRSDVSRRL